MKAEAKLRPSLFEILNHGGVPKGPWRHLEIDRCRPRHALTDSQSVRVCERGYRLANGGNHFERTAPSEFNFRITARAWTPFTIVTATDFVVSRRRKPVSHVYYSRTYVRTRAQWSIYIQRISRTER